MGIKGLKQFLRSKFPSVLISSHLSQYRYSKAALDLLPYLYRYKASFGDTWIHGLSILFQTFIINQVHVTVIMDGPMVVKEKDREREKRKESRNQIRMKIEHLEQDLLNYKESGIVTDLLESISNKISVHRSLLLGSSYKNISIEAVNEYIQTLRKQLVVITPEDIQDIQELCKSLQLTFLFARQEAESYASYLCLTKQVDLVITEDTDVLCYQCPLWISSVQHDGSCIEVEYSNLLHVTGFNSDQFTTFCMLCGTDFNQTKKGVGPVSAFKLVSQSEMLENWLKKECSEEEKDALQLSNTRDIFLHPCSDAILSKFDTTIIPITILFNHIPLETSVFELQKKGYPLSHLAKWIKEYSNRFQ